MLAGTSCANGQLARIMESGRFPFQLAADLPQMCTRLNAMFSFTTGTAGARADADVSASPVLRRPVTQWVDEPTALAYDAAKLTLNAVCRTADIPTLANRYADEEKPADDLNADCRPGRTDALDIAQLRAWIRDRVMIGATGTFAYGSDRAARREATRGGARRRQRQRASRRRLASATRHPAGGRSPLHLQVRPWRHPADRDRLPEPSAGDAGRPSRLSIAAAQASDAAAAG
ncbi:hypothetical protein MXD61_26210 [Frankia sp. AgPm24]|uniref:hypothetical protein n=1 Tax=Frankia sp. AgPm24 TaxID=631128 RepID=UPI00200DDEBA|nr:hypothetical protein [Frankia sp. AgPm24]MCK9925326.1 hypothetical protein [Frankia sp. AgPm24]